MSTIAQLNIDITGSTAGLKSSMDQAASVVESAGDKMQSAGKALSVGVSAPLTAIGGLALNAANSLNQNLGNVQSLGVTQARVEELRDSIQEMSIAVGKDTNDLGDGLYQVVSAFGDSADTAKILETNARAAAAGLASTTDAINLTSAVTKGYGDTSAEAVQDVADLAFKTVQLGQTTFPELASSMGRVVPLGASMGASMEELFGVMATATGVTGSAAEVSTQLRGVLQSMAAPTAQMSSLIEEWGYSSGSAALEAMGVQGVIEGIVAEAESSGQPLQKYISSIEGQTLALALAGPQADVFTEKLAAMGSASGAMEEAFLAQTEGINANGFALQQARQKMNVFLQTVGQALGLFLSMVIDLVMPLTDHIQRWAEAFANLSPRFQLIIGFAGAFLAALGPTLFILGQVASSVAALAPIFGALGAAIGLVLSPLGLVVAGIAALIAFDIGGVRTKIVGFANSASEAFSAFGKYIGAVLEDGDYMNDWVTHLPEAFQPWAEAIGRVIANWDGLKQAATDTWDAVKWIWSGEGYNVDWWWDITGAIADAFGIPEETADAWADKLYDIGTRVSEVVDGMRGAFNLLWDAFSGDATSIETMIDQMTSVGEAFGTGVMLRIVGIAGAIRNVRSAITEFASSEDLETFKTSFSESMSEIGSSIQGLLTGEVSFEELKTTITTELAGLGTAIQELLAGEAFQGIKTAFSGLFEATGITGALTSVKDTITSVFDELTPYLEGPIARLKESFSGLGEIDVTPITEGLQSIKDAFSSIFGDEDASGAGFDIVAGLGLAALQIAIEGAAVIVDTAIGTFQAMIDTVGNILTLFGDAATAIRDTIDAAINQDIAGVFDGVRALITSFVEFFGEQLQTITNLGSEIAESVYEFVGFTFEDIGILLNEPEWLVKLIEWIPEVPEWVTSLTTWDWEMPSWVGNLINFRIPRPGWLNTLDSIVDTLTGWRMPNPFGGNQLGTAYFGGGMSWVGESGPELVALPRGSQVFDTHTSRRLAGGEGVQITIENANIRSEDDLYRLAEELDALRRRRGI